MAIGAMKFMVFVSSIQYSISSMIYSTCAHVSICVYDPSCIWCSVAI